MTFISTKWLLLTLFEAALILWCAATGLDIILCVTIFIWADLVLYSLERLREHSIFLAFLVSFFTFLMGRQVLEVFGFHEIVERFPVEIEIHSEIVLAISLVGLCCGYMIAPVVNYNEKKRVTDNVDKEEVHRVRALSKTWFYAALIPLIAITIESAVFVGRSGYLASYVSFRSMIPRAVHIFAETCQIAFYLFLATLPSRRECQLPIASYSVYLLLSLTTGKRFICIAGFLILFVYYNFRDWFTDQGTRRIKLRYILIVLATTSVLAVFAYIVGRFRLGTTFHDSSLTRSPLIDLLYEQGVSINVIKRSYQYRNDLNQNRLYLFGTILRILTSNPIARLFGIQAVGGNTIENALNGYSLAHSLSYIVMGQRYLDGGGTGSSYIAEVYYSFGYVGVLLANIFYGALLKLLVSLWNQGYLSRALVLTMLEQLFFAPRGNFDGFLGALLGFTTWGTFLTIIFIARQYAVRNRAVPLSRTRRAQP